MLSELMLNDLDGYKIIRKKCVGNVQFLLAHKAKSPEPYVTWESPIDSIAPRSGHYFMTGEDAVRDFNKRINKEMDLSKEGRV